MIAVHVIQCVFMDTLEQLEEDFLLGRIETLRWRACPTCGEFGLLFSVNRKSFNPHALPGRKYRSSINIWCRGTCNSMISHLDGFCPEWAENIDDWDEFSDKLVRSANE